VDWQGSISLGARMGGALVRIGRDHAEEWRGGALPRTGAQLARADAINTLLAGGGVASRRVTRASLPGVTFESSNCRNFLVALEWDGPGDFDADHPATLYAKLPCDEIATRVFANAVGFWAVECAFARNVATELPIRVPRVFAVAERGARFVLLLENLHEESATRLFTNRDMAAGTTVERARLCLETFAELHAAFWNADQTRRETLFPRRLHTYLAPGARRRTRALNAASIAPAHRAAPEVFTAKHAALCRRAVAKWDALIDAWYAEPLTLIHGDSHLANCFEYAGEGGPRMGMIDFQGMQWCHGIRDVQYFLINSLDPERLAAHEADLIAGYVAALVRAGVVLDEDQARERYCAYAFQTLMVAVVSLGLGSLTERDETVRTILARSVAAIDRLDFADWLERL
jgi:aminoglycoside/choline kinase family phosphotransferase